MKISVITVLKNGAALLEETIVSVIVQKAHVDLDYLVVDGGSTDGTLEMIKAYSEHISWWVSEPDHGVYDAMNKGWAAASDDSFILFLAISIVRVIFMQIPMLIYGMFTADCMEYGAYTTKHRTEGLAFSIQTFVTKLGGALASAFSLWLLQYFGYLQQSATQSPQALNGIWALMTIIPSGGYIVMLIIMLFFYDLKESDVQRMVDEMKQEQTQESVQ